ncbi:MAG: tail sheath stabilizer and completion protein [bacterium]
MHKYYYPRTFKGITVALLDLFNDISVLRYDSEGNSIGSKKVPLTYGPMEKYHLDRKENHYYDADNKEHNQRYYLQIPRMAIYMTGIIYNSERATSVNNWRYWFKESLELTDQQVDNILTDYQPAPYDYGFTLHIKCDDMLNLSQIFEHILPYFNPSLDLRVKEFSFLNIERDLNVRIDGVNPEYVDDQNEQDSRYLNATINLTVEGFQYRPILRSSGIIKTINTKYLNYDTGSLYEGFNTSAYETSSGIITSDRQIPTEYLTSGYYSEDNKEFTWYKDIKY